MKTWRASHECPVEGCIGKIVTVYDVGKDKEEFYPVLDRLTCTQHHEWPAAIFIEEDRQDYENYIADKLEEALESYLQGKSDRY